MSGKLSSVLICGSGLAAEYVAAALDRSLPQDISITFLETPQNDGEDYLYGTVSTPTSYSFHNEIGLSEPDIMTKTHTVFSYGTQYKNWGDAGNWVLCFNLPFPVWDSVPFHHYLAKTNTQLEPLLPGAIAGQNGRFVHPPNDQNLPISRAEYGYQFNPTSLTNIIRKIHSSANRVVRVQGKVDGVNASQGKLNSISLANGKDLTADLFIDVTGMESELLSALGIKFTEDQNLYFAVSEKPYSDNSPPLRQVYANDNGWISDTPLRHSLIRMGVSSPENKDDALNHHFHEPSVHFELKTGKQRVAWVDNCVSLGLSAAVTDPISPTPYLLLQKDIERLLSLFPVTKDMSLEAREYNRLFDADYKYATIFSKALYKTTGFPDTPYWTEVSSGPIETELERKLVQFNSRGLFVSYDHEPYNEQDWMILHFGMGRIPARDNIFIDHLSNDQITQKLAQMKTSLDLIVKKLPPHDRYIARMLEYLEKKK